MERNSTLNKLKRVISSFLLVGMIVLGVMCIPENVKAADVAHREGLGVNAGHDLNLKNLKHFRENVKYLNEVSIGHSLIADALYMGLKETIKAYKDCLK